MWSKPFALPWGRVISNSVRQVTSNKRSHAYILIVCVCLLINNPFLVSDVATDTAFHE